MEKVRKSTILAIEQAVLTEKKLKKFTKSIVKNIGANEEPDFLKTIYKKIYKQLKEGKEPKKKLLNLKLYSKVLKANP